MVIGIMMNRHEPSSFADYYDLFDAKFTDTIEIDNGIAYYQNIPYSGRFITKHKNGNVQVSGYYIDGLKEYAWTEFHYDQQRKKYTNYRKGLKHGFSVKWYSYAEEFGSYIDGKKDGLWYEYIGNKKKLKCCLYKQGWSVSSLVFLVATTAYLIYRFFV